MKIVITIMILMLSQFALADIDWQSYNEKTFKTAQMEGKKIVLAFHKKGCSTCRAQDNALEQAGIKNAKNLTYFIVERKNDDHKKVYEKYGFSSRQWAAVVLLDGEKEIARLTPGTTRGEQITNLVSKAQ